MPGALPGLKFVFPLADWSANYYENIKSLLKENNIEFDVKGSIQKEQPEYLSVDFGSNIPEAADLSRMIFREIYGLNQGDPVELFLFRVKS